MLNESNYAGNIIVNLASLPDFLRKPILKKRMVEFFSMDDEEKTVIINNVLEAGPLIPFPNFAKLLRTWLEVVCTLPEEQKNQIFSKYVDAICQYPQKIIEFNLDGILEIFGQLKTEEKNIVSNTFCTLISNLDSKNKRKMMIIIPDNAKIHLGIS
jgi:hypothetical protein